MSVFDEMGVYWAEIAEQNFMEKQIQLLKNTLKRNGLILDLACGEEKTEDTPSPSISVDTTLSASKTSRVQRQRRTEGFMGCTRQSRRQNQSLPPQCLQELLETTDFAVEAVLGGYEGQQFSAGSDRIIVVAHAK